MSLSLFLCSSCQPLAGNGTDMDDAVSLSSSKAAPGKGFHALTKYLLSNDACGLCRVDIGEGKGSFAREIFAAANGSRSRQTYDGILVAMGLSYISVYLFPVDASIRQTFWQPIRTPLPDSATSQRDALVQKSKGKRAIQLVRQESQQNLTTAVSSSSVRQAGTQRIMQGGRSSFLQGVSEHSNIHARDLSLLHQNEESNHPYGQSDVLNLPNSDSAILEYTASDYFQDSNFSRPTHPSVAGLSNIYRKPSPSMIASSAINEHRFLSIMSRKSSERSDPESNDCLQAAPSLAAKRISPTIVMNKSTSSLNQLEPSAEKMDGNEMLPPTPAALSNITKSPFAHLLSEKKDQNGFCNDEEDNATESTMDDSEVRRLAFINDSETLMSIPQDADNNLTKEQASIRPPSAPILSFSSQESEQELATTVPHPVQLLQPQFSNDEKVDMADVFTPVEKKFRTLPLQLQRVLVKCQEEHSISWSVEKILQFYQEQRAVTSKSTASAGKKLASSPSDIEESFQKLLSVLAVIHKGRLGTDGNFISTVCRLCLLEIYLVFSVGNVILSDVASSKAGMARIRKMLVTTISMALSRLNLAIGSPSISQVQIHSAFDSIFPKNIASKLQLQANNDMGTALSPPTMSSSMVMQFLVDDLKKQYDSISEYAGIWKMLGTEIGTYDAAMKSLSPTPQKSAARSSIIMEPLHQQSSNAAISAAAVAVGQAILESSGDNMLYNTDTSANVLDSYSTSLVAKQMNSMTSAVTSNTLRRSNTLIGDKQRLGYHTNRREKKTITIIPTHSIALPTSASSSNLLSSMSNLPAPSNSSSAGSSIRLSLKRSHTTINQLHQSVGNSTAANGSLLSAVVSGSNTQGLTNSGSLAVRSLRAAASSGIAEVPPHSGRAPKRSRSLQPSQPLTDRKYNLGSPSPKRRRSSLADASANGGVSSLLTPVMNHAAHAASFHSPTTSSSTTVGMSASAPIVAPDFMDNSSHRTPQQSTISLSNPQIFCSPVVSLKSSSLF
jgi:hypothetical protein